MSELSKKLSKREQQIMNILYMKGQATVSDVQDGIEDDINYSTVRSLLNILERKGHVSHENIGQKYLYSPKIPKKAAVKNAIHNLLETFFNNSVEQAVTALLEVDNLKLSEKEISHLSEMIENSRKESENE